MVSTGQTPTTATQKYGLMCLPDNTGLAIVADMTMYRCQPAAGPVDAVVSLPGSKSLTNRALIMAGLADGHSLLRNILLAGDTRLMIEALRALGIAMTIDEQEKVAEVTGCRGQVPASKAELFCGNSGTTIRFCAAVCALGQGRFILDGEARMRERPIGGLAAALQSQGAGVEYLGEPGYPPVAVHASGLHGGHVTFSSPESSQWISALLMAAPYAQGDLMIEVTGPVPSLPYLRMTTRLMDRFNVAVLEQYPKDEEGRLSCRFIVAASQRYQGTHLTIEPDASSATYFLAVPAVVGGRVTIEHLGTNSLQGDVGFVDLLERMGCAVTREPDRLTVSKPAGELPLRGIDVDLNDMPDTAPTLAVVALFAKGPTTIRHVASLRVKETDRLSALSCELRKFGAHVEEEPDSLTIHPPETIHPPDTLRSVEVETYQDHRMAMSFALAGLKCPGVVIRDPRCCGKTFPGFFDYFERLVGSSR